MSQENTTPTRENPIYISGLIVIDKNNTSTSISLLLQEHIGGKPNTNQIFSWKIEKDYPSTQIKKIYISAVLSRIKPNTIGEVQIISNEKEEITSEVYRNISFGSDTNNTPNARKFIKIAQKTHDSKGITPIDIIVPDKSLLNWIQS